MIVDICLFSAETDVLELRFRTLKYAVDRFAVVACSRTHQGQPLDRRVIEESFLAAGEAADVRATLHWVEPQLTLERHGRIYERGPDERGAAGSIWFQSIERQHRDGCLDAAQQITDDPDAVVLVSDVDEIPSPEAIRRAAAILHERSAWLTFAMRFHSTALDLLHPQQPWWGTAASRLAATSPQAQRDARTTIGSEQPAVEIVDRGGWHLSWIGTDEERRRKLETFSHAEHAAWDPAAGRREQRHINGEPLIPIALPESYALDFPAPLIDGTFKLPADWLSEDAWQQGQRPDPLMG